MAAILHPDLFKNPTSIPTFVRSYDIYALGLVLFEIRLWAGVERFSKSVK
jgi:hypothetical protein